MNSKVKEIKHFNRFYLRMMGLFSQYSVSSYSATEAMILHEVNNKKDCTASYLSEYYQFDKGYISRIIGKFTRENLIKKIPFTEDRRIQHLEITKQGKEVLNVLSTSASANVEKMIKNINEEELHELVESMNKIEALLKEDNNGCD